MADDLARFMYNHKISTATLGGHGIGGLLALKAATRHFDRFTGFFGLDFTPFDYNRYDAFQEVKKAALGVSQINLTKPRAAILNDINAAVEDPKLRSLFRQSLIKQGNSEYTWAFNASAIATNLQTPKNFGSWDGAKQGQFPGRATMIFPEYSKHVFVGTNTLPMYNTFPTIQQLGVGIHSIQCEDNPNSNLGVT